MTIGRILAGIVIVLGLVFAAYMINIDQTQVARLPDVDIDVEGGQAPEFAVETGEIEAGTEEVTVTVPTLDVEPAPAD